MTEQIQGSAEQVQISDQTEKTKKDTVAYDTYRRAMSELKEAQAKLKEQDAQRKLEEDERLKTQNEWKQIAERREKELADMRSHFEEQNSWIEKSVKLNAVYKHLGGKLKHQDYSSFIPLDKVLVNPETKLVDEATAKEVAAEFASTHSSLVEFRTPRLPNEAPGQKTTMSGKSLDEMTREEIQERILSLHKAGQLK